MHELLSLRPALALTATLVLAVACSGSDATWTAPASLGPGLTPPASPAGSPAAEPTDGAGPTGSPEPTDAAATTPGSPAPSPAETAAATPPTSPAPSPGEAVVPTLNDPTLAASVAASGLEQPTAIAFIGDDDFLVIEKASGQVHRVQGGQLSAEAVLDLAVNYFDERGLLGIELHPEFSSNGYVYLYWTARDVSAAPESLLGEDTDEPTEVPLLGNRVDRFTWDGSTLAWDQEIVRLLSNTLDTDTSGRIRGNHDAGPLEFGPDGMLYVQNGDQNLRGQLQNIADGPEPDDANMAGMILRLNDDGSAPQDNPFYEQGAQIGGEVGENIQMLWAYGIRNSFGLRFHPETGELWQTENGDDSWDELNRFTAGANSGWIQLMGPATRLEEYRQIEIDSPDGLDNPEFPPDQLAETPEEALQRLFALEGSQYVGPLLAWRYPPAVTALEFVTGDQLGASSANTVFLGTVLTDSLLRYPLADDGTGLALDGGLADGVDDNASKGDLGESADFVVGTGFGVVTDILLGPDGRLYVVSLSNNAVYALGASDGAAPQSPAPSPAASPGASPATSPEPTG